MSISFKKKYHPTDTIKFFDSFDISIAQCLLEGIKKLKKNDKKDKYYKMDKKLSPSQEDIHKLLSIVCEISIINIQNFMNSEIPQTLATLDPTLIDRFFEIEIQCITMTDAINVASNGWNIFSKLALFIDKSDTIRDNFVNLFQIGMNNFNNEELCPLICEFLFNCLQKVPFNNKKTLKGLEKTDFNYLTNLFFTNLFNLFRTFSELEKQSNKALFFGYSFEIPTNMKNIMSISSAISNALFRDCSKEILSDLFTFFLDLVYDQNLPAVADAVKDIVSAYCINTSEEQAQKIIKEFQAQLDLTSSNPLLFGYYSTINATLLISKERTIESVNKTVDLILPHTKNDNENIRKIAWHALYLCLSYFSFSDNSKVTIKSDKTLNENSPLVGRFEDFEIESLPILDLSEKAFEVYNPIFENLMQEKDQYKILSILNEIGSDISLAIQNIYLETEGSIEFIYNNDISNVPQLIKKSVPIKDKFMEVMCRIIHDFPENQALVTKIMNFVENAIFHKYNNTFYFLENLKSFDENKKKMTKEVLQLYIYSIDCNRKSLLYSPLSKEIKHFIDLTIDLIASNDEQIRLNCTRFLVNINSPYKSYIAPNIISKIIEKKESIPVDVFVFALKNMPSFDFLVVNDHLLCQTILHLLKNFNKNSKEKSFLDNLNDFIQNVNDQPLTVPSESNIEYENFLNEIETKYLVNAKTNRSLKNVILQLIRLSLKHIKNANDNILKFVIDCITHFDEKISPMAVSILTFALSRKANFTKERIEIKKFPTFETMPNILDKVVVKMPSNGFYFPSSKNSSENAETDEDIAKLWTTPSAEYSVDIEATKSIDVNMDELTEDEDIIKVFETFKSIEIEWKMTEEERLLFDSEYMSTISAGYFKFADHYKHKSYKFSDNKMFLKEIPNLFASAINSNDIHNGMVSYSRVDYTSVWKQYALNFGPSCIKKLAKLSKKYLAKYFAFSPEITSKVLYDMINGFMYGSAYWTIEDRISFYKLVTLPCICVIASSHNSSYLVDNIIVDLCHKVSPFSFAPIIKVIFELYKINKKNRFAFAQCFSSLISIRPMFMIHSIDQINSLFIDQIDESNKKEISVLSRILMKSLFCLNYTYKGSPLYSDKIESKKIEYASILDKILQKENAKDFLTSFLINAFSNFAYIKNECQLLTAPIFIKNFHNIFKLLKDTKISTEDLFFNNFKYFLSSNVFFSNQTLKNDFLTSFITELMNSPLAAQSILLDSINSMIEMNIFTFDDDEYSKYEDMFTKYGRVVKAANLGNELRLKVAKILGIFEIRKCTLKKWNYSSEKVEDSEIDDVILKAAAVVLNSYLFDKVDDNLKNALETLENLCIGKKKGSANYEFFNSVLNIFITRHSGHVIKDVEELIIQCQTKTSPSYIT